MTRRQDLERIERALRETAAILSSYFRSDLAVERKEGGDPVTEADRAAKDTARELLRRAVEIEGEKQKNAIRHALATQSEARLRAMLTVASSEPEVAIAAEQLDADPWLLSCGNGTVDLGTGEFRPHEPANLISLGTDVAYDPDAGCPRWERFLDEVFDGDHELVRFIRRAIGPVAVTGTLTAVWPGVVQSSRKFSSESATGKTPAPPR